MVVTGREDTQPAVLELIAALSVALPGDERAAPFGSRGVLVQAVVDEIAHVPPLGLGRAGGAHHVGCPISKAESRGTASYRYKRTPPGARRRPSLSASCHDLNIVV